MPEIIVKERGPLGFAVAAIFNFFILLLANAHELWRPWFGGVVTDAFSQVVWAIDLTCLVQIIGNLVLYVRSPWWLRRVVDLVFAVAGLVGAIVMYRVFPFSLERFGDLVVVLAHVVLFLGIFGTSVAIFVNLVKIASGEGTSHPPPHPSHP